MTNTLIEGDPLTPDAYDTIAQSTLLPVGKPIPDGWRVMTGNNTDSLIMRVAYRYEIDD